MAAARKRPQSAKDLDILRSLAARIDPRDAGAHNNLGVVYYQKGLVDDAISQFERALTLDPRMQVAQRNLEIAYFHTGYYDRRVAELQAQLVEDEDDVEAREELARMYQYAGEPGKAAVHWLLLIDLRPDRTDYYRSLARAESERGRLDAAVAYLRRAEQMDAADTEVKVQLGELLYNRGLTDEALEMLEAAVALDESLPHAHHLLAFVYGDLSREEEAAAAARKAAELNPTFTKTEKNLSLDRYNIGLYDELVGDKRQRPEPVSGTLAHYNVGLALRQRGLYEEALREFETALERGEDEQLVQQAQAELYLLQGNGVAAASLYDTLVRSHPDSPKLWNERGVVEHRSAKLAEAARLYRRSLDLDPDYTLARNNLAIGLAHGDDLGGAEAAFELAVGGADPPPEAWTNYALLLSRSSRHAEALRSYRRALEIDPQSAAAWTGVGTALLEMGKAKEARTALVHAVQSDPELAEARYQLAFALSALGDYQGSLRETKRAIELDPVFPAPRYRLLIDLQFEESAVLAPELEESARVEPGSPVEAFAYEPGSLDRTFAELESDESEGDALEAARDALARGQLERASAEVRRAVSSGGGATTEQLLLQGEIYLQRGLAGEALDRFDAVLRREEVGEDRHFQRALLGRAQAALVLGRGSEAKRAAARLLEMGSPDNVPAILLLGRASVAQGEFTPAIRALKRACELAPRDPVVLTELGLACEAAGELAQAQQALGEAIDLEDGAVAARVALGRVLTSRGQGEEAIEHYRVALELLPSYGEAALSLAELLRQRGDVPAAVRTLVDVLSVDPYHVVALVRLGNLLREAGRADHAATSYRRALKLDPDNTAALAGMRRIEESDSAISRG